MRSVNTTELKRFFQISVIIMLIVSGLGILVFNLPAGESATAYDVSLTVNLASQQVSAGSQVTYAFTITNEGNNGDRYTIQNSVSSLPATGWQVTLSKTTTSNIASGNTDTFTVSVRAPAGANISAYCYATIKVASQTDPLNSSQSVLISTIIKRTYGVSISSPGIRSMNPGGSLTYNFYVKNEGNDRDGYKLEAITVPTGWSASVDFDTGRIDPGTSKAATMTIQGPTDAKAQSYQFVVKAQSITDSNTSATRTITANVNQTYKLSIQSDGVKQVDVTSQTVVNFNVKLTNLGNGEDQFNLEYYIPPQFITAGWGGDLSTTTTSKVAADKNITVTFFVYPPSKSLRPAVNSKGEFYINASSVGNPLIKRSVKVSCVVLPFYDVRVLNTGASLQTVNADGTVSFNFNVTNTGNDQDTLDFTVTAPEGFQDVSIEPSSITLARDASQKVMVTVTPDPDVVLAQTYTFRIDAKSSHGPSTYSTFQVKINKKYGAFLDAPNGAIIPQAQPGTTYNMMVRLQNKGNGKDAFNLAIMGETSDIQTNWSPLISAATTPLLDSDETYYFNITVSAPSSASEGTYKFEVNASSQNSPVFKTIWLSVRIPQIYAVDISANKESVRGQFSNDTGSPRVVYFEIDVFNRGSGTDSSVSVSVLNAPSGFAGLYSIYFIENSKSKIIINSDSSKPARLVVDMPKISSGIDAGTYQFIVEARSDNGTISNTNDDKVKTITLNLVLDPVHRVRVMAGLNNSRVGLGSSVSFQVIVQNRGTASDYYSLTVEYPDYGRFASWKISSLTTNVLEPLEQQAFILTANISIDANTDWGSVWAKITATHSEDDTVTDSRYFTAIFADAYAGDLASTDVFEQGLPGEVASFMMSLVNRGTRISDTFTIEMVEDDVSEQFENVVISPSLLILNSNQRANVYLNVSIPSIDDKIIETGTYDLTFKAISEGETTQDTDDVIVATLTFKVKVMPVYKVQFVIPEGSKSADPGTKLQNIKLNITNKGNEPATINVNLQSSLNKNWVSISPSTISDLAPNGAKDVLATIDVKSDALSGKVTFTFNASVYGKSTFAIASFEVDVNEEFEPDLSIPSGTTSKDAEPGDTVTYTVKLKNLGNSVDGFDITMTSTKSDWVDFGFEGSTPANPLTSIDDLGVDAAKNIWVTIEVDDVAAAGEVTFTLKATSKGDISVSESIVLKVVVLPNRDVELVTSVESKEMVPDVDQRNTEVTYEVQVRNKGEATDSFNIQVLKSGMGKPVALDQATWDAIIASGQFSDKPDWVILSKKVTSSIAKGQSETITVTFRVPDSNYAPSEYVTYIWAYSEGDTPEENKYSEPLKLTTKVKQSYGADIKGEDLARTQEDPEDPSNLKAYFDIIVRNTGTGLDDFQLEIEEDLSDDFDFIYVKEISDVTSEDDEAIRVELNIRSDTLTGKYNFRARYISAGDDGQFKVTEDYVTAWKTFTIDVKQTYGVDLDVEMEKVKGDVGDDVVFKLTMSNLGNDIDTFRIEVRELETDGWATLSNTKLSLDAKGDANEKKTFTLTVRIPDDTEEALAGTYDYQITIKRDSTSVAEQNKATDTITLTVEVEETFQHFLETEDNSEEVKPGETVSYRFKVRNEANTADTFYLTVKGTKSDWAQLQYDQISLGPKGADDEMWVWLNVTVPDLEDVRDPEEVEAGTYDFTVEVNSKGDRDAAPEKLDFEVDVEQKFDVEIGDIKNGGELGNYKRWDVNDVDDLEVEITIQNNGNKDDTFLIKKPSSSTGWEITVSQTHVAIPMGDEKTITVTISFYAVDGFVFGTQSLKFEVIPDDGSTQGKKYKEIVTLYINAEVPELVLRDDSLVLPSDPVSGRINEVTVTVYNIGNADAKDVEVVLYDGKQSYRTDKKNVPASGKTNFTFEWKPTSGDHKLIAKVNEGNLIIEQDTDNNEVDKKNSIPLFSLSAYIGNIWVVVILLVIILIVIIVVVFLAMNKNREIRELEEIITRLKAEGSGPGGPRKVIKETAGAPMAPAAAGLPSAPGKLAPVPPAQAPDARGAKKENVKVQCPKCLTQQVVTIDKRPAEVPCKECGVTLVIPEKKK
ncbi:MAG: hypothetical protein JXA22_06875 [Candidatus Thermoplasmatota archaeon]|nr:hypothetical protein [Candidatus Thermoplasmatota archaeon]